MAENYSKPLYEIKAAGATLLISYDNLIDAKPELDKSTRMKIAIMDVGEEMLLAGVDSSMGIISIRRIA